LNLNLISRIENINIKCKKQEMKVDTDAGLVDTLTIQIILSSSSLHRLIITFSTLIEVNLRKKKLFYNLIFSSYSMEIKQQKKKILLNKLI